MDTGVNGVKLPNAQLLVVRGPGQGDATATIQAHKMAANIARTRLRVTPELSTACFLYVLVKRLIEQLMSYMGGLIAHWIGFLLRWKFIPRNSVDVVEINRQQHCLVISGQCKKA